MFVSTLCLSGPGGQEGLSNRPRSEVDVVAATYLIRRWLEAIMRACGGSTSTASGIMYS